MKLRKILNKAKNIFLSFGIFVAVSLIMVFISDAVWGTDEEGVLLQPTWYSILLVVLALYSAFSPYLIRELMDSSNPKSSGQKKESETIIHYDADNTHREHFLIDSLFVVEDLPKEQYLKVCDVIYEQMKCYRALPYQIVDCSYIGEGKAWAPYNKTNQVKLLISVSQLNNLLLDFKSLYPVLPKAIPVDYFIDFDNICFDFGFRPKPSDPPRSYCIYQPYTKKGHHSKYPLIAFFNTIPGYVENLKEFYMGEIYYAINGDVAKAKIICGKDGYIARFSFSYIGGTFLISKVEFVNNDGKWVVLYDCNWKLTDYT